MMSITSLFRRHQDIFPDPQIPLDVHEVDVQDSTDRRDNIAWTNVDDGLARRNNIAWGEKPAELVQAASQEWLRPRPAPPEPGFVSLTEAKPAEAARIPWTRSAPTVAGPYWYVEQHGSAINLCIVIDFGGRLCIRQRGTDSCTYVSVSQLDRYWSGPLPIPVGVDLEDLA